MSDASEINRIRECKRVVTDNDPMKIARLDPVNPDHALAAAHANLKSKILKTPLATASAPVVAAVYDNSAAVVEAIEAGKLSKRDAITYVEKLKLISPEKLDELTATAAYNILTNDIKEEQMANKLIEAETVSPGVNGGTSGGEKVVHEDFPKPDGKENFKGQMPSTTVSTESDVNQSKPENKFPKPDGSVNPHKWQPHTPPNQADDTSSAKFEDRNKLTPKKVGSSEKTADDVKTQMPSTEVSTESDVNTAKPEDGEPAPKGKVNVKPQMPSTEVGTSDVNTAKPEEKQPEPKKGQMAPPMPLAPDGGDPAASAPPVMDEEPPMPKEDKGMDLGAPKDKGLGDIIDKGMGGGKAHAPFMKMLDDATSLIADIKEFAEEIDNKINKKEKKPKGGGEGAPKSEGPKGDAPKSDAPKAEDKSEKKDSPFPPKEKKEDKGMPPMLAYKVELVKDEKSAIDSYYVASLNSKPLFSVSLKQAFIEKPEAYANDFHSTEYADALVSELNASGAKNVFQGIFGSRGYVIAQSEKAPMGNPGAGLPEDKFSAPAQDMNAAPEVTNNLANDDTQKESFADLVLEVAAATIAGNKTATAQEFVDEFRDIFSDETKAKEFEGRLSEKVENKKKTTDEVHTPDAYSGGAPAPSAGPSAGAMPSPAQAPLAASKLQEIKAFLGEMKEVIKERNELKNWKTARLEEDVLKARVTATVKIAEQKAEYGIIDENDIKEEAIRLAKLSDDEVTEEVKILKNSIKIAKKMNKKADCTITESNNSRKAAVDNSVLSAIPSQTDLDIKTQSNFEWSKGFTKTK